MRQYAGKTPLLIRLEDYAQGVTLVLIYFYININGIKLDKTADLVSRVKKSLEAKLEDVHASLRTHEDWNEEYQALLSQERKYLYALNRIEQYETEERIAEFESKLNELDVVV